MPKRSGKPLPPTPETPPARAIKSTDAQVIERVNILVKMTLDGYSRADMLEYGLKKWGLDPGNLDNTYFPKVREQIKKQAEARTANAYDEAIERTMIAHQIARRREDIQGMIRAQAEFNKLMGLYKPVKQEVEVSGSLSGEITDLSHLTFEELYALKYGKDKKE